MGHPNDRGVAGSQETWQAMEKLVDEGLVRSIGISNYSGPKTKEVQSYARIQPVTNQARHDLRANACITGMPRLHSATRHSSMEHGTCMHCIWTDVGQCMHIVLSNSPLSLAFC